MFIQQMTANKAKVKTILPFKHCISLTNTFNLVLLFSLQHLFKLFIFPICHDHKKVFIAVIIQRMIIPTSSGVMFTVDPITSKRNVTSINASYGLGEAIVSGIVNPDNYTVINEAIISKKISIKNKAIYALKSGGTEEKKLNMN